MGGIANRSAQHADGESQVRKSFVLPFVVLGPHLWLVEKMAAGRGNNDFGRISTHDDTLDTHPPSTAMTTSRAPTDIHISPVYSSLLPSTLLLSSSSFLSLGTLYKYGVMQSQELLARLRTV